MSRWWRRTLWSWWLVAARRASRAYVAGPELTDALPLCRTLARQGVSSTICPWNSEDDSPRRITDTYLAAVNGLVQTGLDGTLSVKAPALGFSRDLLGEVLQAARRGGIGVHFDALTPDTTDGTLALVEAGLKQWPELGCTLPGRWRRSLADGDWAVSQGLVVRVVKGQWPDPDAPDYEARAGFLAVVERLAGRARRVAVATHDAPLARAALGTLLTARTPCEMQLLYGLPIRNSLRVARALGVPVRIYVPYGAAWLPYCLTQARRNPRIVWWTARDWLLGRSFRLPAGEGAG
jgi:proline dehydrogenase